MQNFEFLSPTKIIFGRDTEERVGGETAARTRKALLHYGGGSIKSSGLYDRVAASLRDAGVDFVELGGVQPNPRLSLVQEGIELCRREGIEFVLAVGGGSVIDSAKAIAVGVPYSGDVWDFYLGKEPKEAISVGVVLTIAAAGSEASKSSVITNEEGWYKKAINYDIIRPVFAIMNPELMYTLPAYQTAAGAVDIMAHVMERYFTNERDVEFTDRLCAAVLRTVINNAPTAIERPQDYSARAQLMWASTLAHNDLLGTGRESDGGSHMVEHEISGIYDVAHGAGLAVVFPAWMRYMLDHKPERLIQYAVEVWHEDYCFDDPLRTAKAGIQRQIDFYRRIGMPTSLAEMGIDGERLEEMAEKCTAGGPVGHLKQLYKEDVFEILKLAL